MKVKNMKAFENKILTPISSLLAFSIISFFVSLASAQSALDICVLANTPLPASGSGSISGPDSAAAEYLRKINLECEISEKHLQMKIKARQKWNLSLEQIAEYQAMRYIRRGDYEAAKYNGTPVPLTYQLFKSDYLKENSQKSSLVWEGFLLGIQQLESERQRLISGGRIDIAHLQTYHREFYKLSSEEGDFSHSPYPGVIKAPGLEDRFWWRLKPEDVESTVASVRRMNEAFADRGLLPSGLERLQAESYQMEVLNVRSISDGSGVGIYSGDSRANRGHIDRVLEFVNQAVAQARSGQHIVWNGRLYTPGEVAMVAQQFFVAVHPFSEGNGRVSRLLQELIHTTFNMPHGSSGDLMQDDVLTPPAEYYRLANQSTQALLQSVDRCLETVYPAAVMEKKSGGSKNEDRSSKPQRSILDVPDTELEYGCRILR